jgi:hypothetical protein
MSSVPPRVGRHRGHTTQVGPGALGVEPFGIITGGHKEGGSGVGPDTEQTHQVGSRGQEKGLDLLIQLGDLLIETLNPAGQ